MQRRCRLAPRPGGLAPAWSIITPTTSVAIALRPPPVTIPGRAGLPGEPGAEHSAAFQAVARELRPLKCGESGLPEQPQ